MIAESIDNLIEIPLPHFQQPSPAIMDGGDCGYCCIAAAFNLPSVLAAYELVERTIEENDQKGYFERGRCHSDVNRLQFFLSCMGYSSKEHRPPHYYYKAGCTPVPWANVNWYKFLRKHLEAGHPCFSSMILHGHAPAPDDDASWLTDHMVMIVGCRKHTVPLMEGKAGRIDEEIMIQCSVKGRFWIKWRDYLFWHVGYPTIPFLKKENK
jgi:hypothetical protein